MASKYVRVEITTGDSYSTADKVEVKVDIPDAETAAILYTQLRNDLRRIEDSIREKVASLALPV